MPTALGLTSATDTGISHTDGITADVMPTITGGTTGHDGDVVTVYDGGSAIGSATVSSGAWSFTPTSALSAGAHSLTATETDLAGNVSTPTSAFALLIETVAPVPTALGLTSATDTGSSHTDGITADTTPTITGTTTGADGETVKLYDGTTAIGSGTVSGGAWSVTPTSALSAGSHTLSATETDLAGNVSTPSGALAVTIETTASVPSVLGLTSASDTGVLGDGITHDTTPTITGTTSGADGEIVTLHDGSTVIGSGMVNGGTWSVTPSHPAVRGASTP